MSDLLDWAKREVEIACKKENPSRKESEFDYECACYESALKAFERRIIDKMFPITMPYMPGRPIKVCCEDFLTDKKNGDFDTVGVFYALKTENGKQEKSKSIDSSESQKVMKRVTGLKYLKKSITNERGGVI